MRAISIMSSVLRVPEQRNDYRTSDGKPMGPPRSAGSSGGRRRNDYPTSDGKPMAETDWHRDLMVLLIDMLRAFFHGQRVYVSGNLLVFYKQGNRRRHISPDVFVVRGVENHPRDNYLLWEERRGPQVAIEITSSSTRNEDRTTKRALYQDTLKVREYFLFDPYAEWLDPPLQGFRLRQGVYQPIRTHHGRLVSQVLKLHLERDGRMLRLWDPRSGAWLPTPAERLEQVGHAREKAEQRAQQEAQARAESEAESERLRRENEELRRRLREIQ
jgi:Uma2 family endonuclease